jgi:hypothetical protein
MIEIPEHAEDASTYCIKAVDGVFLVLDSAGDRVSTCAPTEEAAREEIAACEKEDMLWRDAKALVEAAVEKMMQTRSLDRETACYWIRSVAELI